MKRLILYGGVIILLALAALFAKNPILFAAGRFSMELQKANPDQLRSDVQTLTALEPPRSFAHPESLDKASAHIAKRFTGYGLKPQMQEFRVDGRSFRNVVVHLGPREGRALIVGAHYDVFGDRPGADDNASGTAGLIELGRLLGPVREELRRPIELVAYTLEEPPNFASRSMGSYVHAQSLKAAGVKIKLMISLEMIGYFRDEPSSQQYPTPALYALYPSVGNYISLIARPKEWRVLREAKALFMGATDLLVQSANIPVFVPGIDLSDQRNYWSAGFPAMMITDTAFMRNPNYHGKGDLAETLDYVRMAEVVNGLASVAMGL